MKLLMVTVLAAIVLSACAVVPDGDGGVGIGIGTPYHHHNGW